MENPQVKNFSKRLIVRMTDKQEEQWRALFPLLPQCTWSDLIRHALMELVRANPHLRPVTAPPLDIPMPLYDRKRKTNVVKVGKKEVAKGRKKAVKV